MLEQFKEIRFKSSARRTIGQANQILAEYEAEEMIVSLRQLYYQFVQRDLITNDVKSYRRLAKTLSDARLAGLIDWEAIEDRGRRPSIWRYSKDANEAIDTALKNFNLNRAEGQDYHAELWVEKDALSAVLRPLAAEYFAPMMVNRGYSSTSAMYEAGMRMREAERAGKRIALLYLGDFDPSGEDMVRDIEERLNMFGVRDLTVEKLALTWEQIQKHKPPPNPAKLTDPRAQEFVRRHGHSSWELDALNPKQLTAIIRKGFKNYLDVDKIEKIKEEEKLQVETAKRRLGEERQSVTISLPVEQGGESFSFEVGEDDAETLRDVEQRAADYVTDLEVKTLDARRQWSVEKRRATEAAGELKEAQAQIIELKKQLARKAKKESKK